MSTLAWRSALIVWAEMLISHVPPVRAGMIESKTVDLTDRVRPRRFAASAMSSMSEPTALLLVSSASCGGYEVSEQAVRVTALINWAAGTVGSGAAVGATDAAVVAAAVAAVVGAAVGVALGAVVAPPL